MSTHDTRFLYPDPSSPANAYGGTKTLPSIEALFDEIVASFDVMLKNHNAINSVKTMWYHQKVVQGSDLVSHLVAEGYGGTRADAVELANDANRFSSSKKLVHCRSELIHIEDKITSYKLVVNEQQVAPRLDTNIMQTTARFLGRIMKKKKAKDNARMATSTAVVAPLTKPDILTSSLRRAPIVSRSTVSNSERQMSRQMSTLSIISNATETSEFGEMILNVRVEDWMYSFHRLDPRKQILVYFNDIARMGMDMELAKCYDSTFVSHNDSSVRGSTAAASNSSQHEEKESELIKKAVDVNSPVLKMFSRASAFTVWRPTSFEAIRKMMSGEGTGKGLDIKGKSAKKGKLSAFVPFLQIHEESHKRKVGTIRKGGRLRIFFRSESNRDEAIERLQAAAKEMESVFMDARRTVDSECKDEDVMLKAYRTIAVYDVEDFEIAPINDFSPNCYGLDVEERLLWEVCVMRQDISRPTGSEHDTGRASLPPFQQMNFAALRKDDHIENEPKAVLWQYNDDDPLAGRDLIMAYEENGDVKPVVSDFDCFLIGTRGVKYSEPLPDEQIDLMKWCIDETEQILMHGDEKSSWTSQWLEVLKKAHMKGFHPETPRYGFGDPKSYSVMESAVGRLQNGAVRHGPECFNYYFPQDLDDEYLVISDSLDGPVPWKYVNLDELQDLLCDAIFNGFTFPLNPKWVLVDPGWTRVYNLLLSSDYVNVKESLNAWFPPGSGLRERLSSIVSKTSRKRFSFVFTNPDAERDLALQQLQRHIILRRAKAKINGFLAVKKIRDRQKLKTEI